MIRIKDWVLEYCFVIDRSKRAYTALILALVAPAGIFMTGAWVITNIDVSGSYSPMVTAVIQSMVKVLLGFTFIIQVKFVLIAAAEYRKAKARVGL